MDIAQSHDRVGAQDRVIVGRALERHAWPRLSRPASTGSPGADIDLADPPDSFIVAPVRDVPSRAARQGAVLPPRRVAGVVGWSVGGVMLW